MKVSKAQIALLKKIRDAAIANDKKVGVVSSTVPEDQADRAMHILNLSSYGGGCEEHKPGKFRKVPLQIQDIYGVGVTLPRAKEDQKLRDENYKQYLKIVTAAFKA